MKTSGTAEELSTYLNSKEWLAMIINHNLTSLSAVNASRITHNMLQKSVQPLATGLRINSAADDASGLAISEKMRSQIAGYSMAVKNAQDGISLLQTAETALGDSSELLHRMRELSIQSANDTLTSRERQHIDEEVQARLRKVPNSTRRSSLMAHQVSRGQAVIAP